MTVKQTNIWNVWQKTGLRTGNGLVGLSAHFLSTVHQYVMLGDVTTDSIEKQLWKLWQGFYFCAANFGKTFNSQNQTSFKTRWGD